MGVEIVTIHVGSLASKGIKTFVMHKKLLCDSSDYFSKAFNGGFIENKGTMELPTDDPDIFYLFVNYIYQGRIESFPIPEPHGPRNSPADYESCDNFVRQLIKLFSFAEKICMNDL